MTKKVETVDISNDDLLFMLNKIVQKPVTNCWESLDDKLKDSVKSVLHWFYWILQFIVQGVWNNWMEDLSKDAVIAPSLNQDSQMTTMETILLTPPLILWN